MLDGSFGKSEKVLDFFVVALFGFVFFLQRKDFPQ